MLRSSRPDGQITAQDVQDWERQRDALRIDFPFIRLSRKEFCLLNSAEKDWVKITEGNKYLAIRLRDLDLGRIIQSTNSSGTEAFEIRDRGKNYLMYFRGIKRQRRIEWIRYIVTTAIAVVALVVAIISLVLQYL